jgi:hypothetical protein
MEDNIRMLAAMQENAPVRSWIKTILGKVYVVAWDSFTEQPTGVMLEGDPKKLEDNTMIDVWSSKEDVFFKNMNKILINRGIIKEFVRSTTKVEKSIEDSTDEELMEILDSKWLSFQSKINKIASIPVLFRLETLAKENDKSDKTIGLVTARVSELQSSQDSE